MDEHERTVEALARLLHMANHIRRAHQVNLSRRIEGWGKLLLAAEACSTTFEEETPGEQALLRATAASALVVLPTHRSETGSLTIRIPVADSEVIGG